MLELIIKYKMVFILILVIGLLLLFLNKGEQGSSIPVGSASTGSETIVQESQTGFPNYSHIEKFGEAFTKARADLGANHCFEWGDALYSTDYKNDWEAEEIIKEETEEIE